MFKTIPKLKNMKRLFICEKPDQAKTLANVSGVISKQNGYIDTKRGIFCWAFGHLLSTKNPEDYDPENKLWAWNTLPILPEKITFKPKDTKASQQIKLIKDLLKNTDEVVVATDADREGEMIGWEILVYLGWKGPIKRLWINDMTPKALNTALDSLLDGEKTKPLYHAALARSQADWLVGMNMTRASTLKFRSGYGNKPLSVGRVQTPTLALIVRQERKILNFKPVDYYEIKAETKQDQYNFILTYRESPVLKDKEKAEKIKKLSENFSGDLKVTKTDKSTPPPLLPDLNMVQQEANSRFGWASDKTLEVLQGLYETHQIVSYPRSDVQVLPESHKELAGDILGHLTSQEIFSSLTKVVDKKILRNSTYDDSKVKSHYAVVPTSKKADMSVLNKDEKELYILISKIYIANHMPDYEYESTEISMDVKGYEFRTTGNIPKILGWKEILQDPKEEEEDEKDKNSEEEGESNQKLPPLKNGQAFIKNTEIITKITKPPARFTEKTLLKAMKSISSYVDDENAKKRLKLTSGIGTSATRANIIKTLKDREYIEVKKRKLMPTSTGMTLVTALESITPSYCDPALTAAWEDILEDIAQGKREVAEFVDATKNRVKKDVKIIEESVGIKVEESQNKNKDNNAKNTSKNPNETKSNSYSQNKKPMNSKNIKLDVKYDNKEEAKKLGARWDSEQKTWVAPSGVDLEPFKKAGFLK